MISIIQILLTVPRRATAIRRTETVNVDNVKVTQDLEDKCY